MNLSFFFSDMFYELKYIFLFGLTDYYEMVDQFVMIFN
jgi:hypothetical protein